MSIQIGSGVLQHTADVQVANQTNNGVTEMNDIKYEATVATLSTYKDAIKTHGHADAISICSNKVKSLHNDYSYQTLALALATASGGDKKRIMEDAWDRLVDHANQINQGYLAGLVLCGSQAALKKARPMALSPIALRIGEAKMYKAFHSLKELNQALRLEPELVDSLKRNGASVAIKDDLRAAWVETPRFLREIIVERAVSPKFASIEKTTQLVIPTYDAAGEKVIHEKKTRVKTHAWADMAALTHGGRAYCIRNGAERALQKALQLAHQYSSSAEFWGEIEPRKPNDEDLRSNEPTYAGEEHKSYESPMRIYEVSGITHAEVYESKLKNIQAVKEDFEEAAAEAEALFDRLESLLESIGDVIYGYTVEDRGAAEPIITAIKDKEEMLDILDARAMARAMKAPAEMLGVSARSEDELRAGVLAQFSDEQQAALLALGGAV